MIKGRQWWSVLGWLAFALGLGLECAALLQGDAPDSQTKWISLVLYVFWGASYFLSGRARQVGERFEPHPTPPPSWTRELAFILLMAYVGVVSSAITPLNRDLNLPFGIVLLAAGGLGWLARPGMTWLLGKRLRRSDTGARAYDRKVAGARARAREARDPRLDEARSADERSGTSPRGTGGAAKTGTSRSVRGALACVVLGLGLYQCVLNPSPSKLKGEEARAALAEVESLRKEAWSLHLRLFVQAKRMRESQGADPLALKVLEERAALATGALGEAMLWKMRLEKGKVRVTQREELQEVMRGIRADLERAKTGKLPAPKARE